MTTPPAPAALDPARMTRAQRATLPLTADVIQALAEQHGVCIRPPAMRRIDTTTGRVEVVPVPCGSTREDQCHPCAQKARQLRMAQCREGWHLDTEPATDRATPSAEHQELMAARADLITAYTECHTPHPNPSNAPPGAAKTHPTYPAAPSSAAPWDGCSPAATGGPPGTRFTSPR